MTATANCPPDNLTIGRGGSVQKKPPNPSLQSGAVRPPRRGTWTLRPSRPVARSPGAQRNRHAHRAGAQKRAPGYQPQLGLSLSLGSRRPHGRFLRSQNNRGLYLADRPLEEAQRAQADSRTM